jgi:hypothetical protein
VTAASSPRALAYITVTSEPQRRLLAAVTDPQTADGLMRGQLSWLRGRGWDVTLASSPGEHLDAVAAREGIHVVPLPMSREIDPKADLRSLIRFIRLLRTLRPTLTHVSTPKAGLIGGLAAWITGVPCRVYTLRGLRLETAEGGQRLLLWLAEWVACRSAHVVIVVSPSLAARAHALRLIITCQDGAYRPRHQQRS